MAPSEAVAAAPLAIARLGADDVAGGLALSDAAGWNQTADDWAFFVRHGHAVGCRDGDGRLVATAAALPYGDALGWIAMVLVAPSHRQRGLATALLDDCVRWLGRSGRVAVLDATPDGEPVYRRLGFAAGFGFTRWQGDGSDAMRQPTGAAVQVTEATPSERGDIVALDTASGPAPRAALLDDFLGRPATRVWLTGRRDGVVVSRAGRRATQIGPLVATSEADAAALLEPALDATAGRVFVDVPSRSTAVAAALERRGFTRQRAFVRMALGGGPVLALGERVHALAGPEFG